MIRSFLTLMVPTCMVTVAGCGGKVTFELANGGAGGTAQTSTHAGTTGKTTGAVMTGPNGTSTNVGTSNVGTSVVATTDVGTSVVGTSVTASTGVFTGPPVSCNGSPCNTGDICCFNPNGPGDHCGQSGQCDPGFVELDCSSPDNCPNGICCATFNQNTQSFEGIACQASCNGPGDITVCTNMPPSPCPNGTQCHKSMQLGDGYRICF